LPSSPARQNLKFESRQPRVGRDEALRLFPASQVFLSRKRDHQRAEAILIASYGFERSVKAIYVRVTPTLKR
jgi:hypothetical protein